MTDQFQSEPYPSAPYPGGNTMTAASPYASWLQRVGAYLIDVAPIVILEIIFSRVLVLYVLILIASLGWTIYNRWYQAGTTGQSLGKKVLKLRLVSEETGQPIGMLMAFVRDICHIIDSVICFIGYLFPLWDAKRQTIADKIVKTVVIPAP
ncbi:MAG TPA: RDD family protein [Streptosporangiaceae bacterium]|nr:RDD family protein [Streptosporangiaceae bacterium]